MSERKRFVDLHLQDEHSIAELCRRFGISGKTGYTWLPRFFEGCELVDRSRRPHSGPHAVARWLEEAIVDARRQRPQLGTEKAARRAAAGQSRRRAAGGEHLRRHLQAQWPGAAEAAAPADSAFIDAVRPGGGAQFALVHRFQRAVPRRQDAVLPAHRDRRVQPLPARLRRAALHLRCAGDARLRADLRRVRGCRRRSAPTTARRSPRARSPGSPSSPPGGSSSAFVTSASRPACRSKTAATSGCT